MKKAIELIRESYAFAGIAPTKNALDGRMSSEGLGFLNELLYKWNADNYFPFTSNTVDGHVSGGRTIISPDDGADLVGPKPINVNKVLFKYCNEWYSLKRRSYENIWETVHQTTIPAFFAFTNDENGNGVLIFDAEKGNFDCRVIYNKNLPEMDFNDVLTAPPQYEQALKYGIAALVCAGYGMPPDVQANAERLRDSVLASIKKTNSFKHSIDAPCRKSNVYDDPAMSVLVGRHL